MQEYWIGSLHFTEVFGDDVVNRLNDLAPITTKSGQVYQVRAEHMSVHEVPLDFKTKYQMVLDRYSYMYPQAIGLFMGYAFQGVYLINNPFSFYYYLRNKDAAYMVARELGIEIPKTYILPPKEVPGFSEADFRYHRFFDWDGMIAELGWPMIIKPAEGRDAIGVHILHNKEELFYYYNNSGSEVMMLQQKVKSSYPWQVRCLCIGKKIIPIKYIFRDLDASEYFFEENFLSPELGQKVLDTCKVINRVLGYEMNSVELFIDEDGVLQAIDFNNPVPDGRLKALGEIYYQDYQKALCELVIDIIQEERSFDFLPNDINRFAQIARRTDLTRLEKFTHALALANEYYESIVGRVPLT